MERKKEGPSVGWDPGPPGQEELLPTLPRGSLTSPVTVSGPSGLLAEYFGCILNPLGGCWVHFACVCVCALSRFSRVPTICDPMDYSLPGSSAHGILQTRILEWVAISCSRASSQLRD